MNNTLTKTDTLTQCEKVIAQGLDTFVDVGRALMAIRDDKLYRASHKTFANYCQERWGFSYRRAAQLIEASGVNENVKHASHFPNARQAEELAKAPTDKQAEIWDALVDEHGDEVIAKEKIRT